MLSLEHRAVSPSYMYEERLTALIPHSWLPITQWNHGAESLWFLCIAKEVNVDSFILLPPPEVAHTYPFWSHVSHQTQPKPGMKPHPLILPSQACMCAHTPYKGSRRKSSNFPQKTYFFVSFSLKKKKSSWELFDMNKTSKVVNDPENLSSVIHHQSLDAK